MRIAVLNGSPKGDTSVTMQYVAFLAKTLPECDFETVNIARRIAGIEKKPAVFEEVLATVRQADAVLWAFPLYYMLCCSQYKRFIELVFERDAGAAFSGTPAAVLTTSIHFFDHTAHNYMRGICEDLGMRFVGAYSADMPDMLKEAERERLRAFARQMIESVQDGTSLSRRFPPLPPPPGPYSPGTRPAPVDTAGARVVIVTDGDRPGSNITPMATRLRDAFGGNADVVDLSAIRFAGPCTGCCRCGIDNECIYEGRDDYIEMHRAKLQVADMIVFAGTVVDRYLSSIWKRFFDRSFFLGHAPSLIGKQFAFVVSGPLGHLPDLREILEAWGQIQQGNVVDSVTDESGDPARIDAALDGLATKLIQAHRTGYIAPPTFLGVGGQLLVRDHIWGRLRAVFQADHRRYKGLGMYDFPQKDLKMRLLNLFLPALLRIPPIRRRFQDEIPEGMIRPYRKVLDRLDG